MSELRVTTITDEEGTGSPAFPNGVIIGDVDVAALQDAIDSAIDSATTDNIQEGSNLYYTTTRFDSDFGDNTTDDLTEGSSNLYYTSVRVNSDVTDLLTGDISTGNITTTGYVRGPSTFVIDPATHGDSTGTLRILGGLTVEGTTTTINSTTVTVDDKNVVLAEGAIDSAASDGAGITVNGSGASILYDHTNSSWDFNRNLIVNKNLGFNNNGGGSLANIRTGEINSPIEVLFGDDGFNGGSKALSLRTSNDSGIQDSLIVRGGSASGGQGQTEFWGSGSQNITITSDGDMLIGTIDGATNLGDDIESRFVLDGVGYLLDRDGGLSQNRLWSTIEPKPIRPSSITRTEAGNVGTNNDTTNFPNVYGEADLSAIEGDVTFTYDQACAAVEQHGARLPTLQELMAGVGTGSGQGYDSHYLWTQTFAGHRKVWVCRGDFSLYPEAKIVDIDDPNEVYRTRAFFDVSKKNMAVHYDNNERIRTNEVRAQSSSGLSLYDDGGNGIFVQNGGKILSSVGSNWSGSVSQSGQSSVFERGSNSNGEYVKFADGTMICWGETLEDASQDLDNGEVFDTFGEPEAFWFSLNFTFPATFASTPAVNPWIADDSLGAGESFVSVMALGRSNSSFTFVAADASPGSGIESLGFIAIGRWY